MIALECHTWLIGQSASATVSRMPETVLELDSPPRWDLTSLFPDVEAALASLAGVLAECNDVPRPLPRPGRSDLTADELGAALDELESLDNRLSRLGSYSGLALSTNITGEAERDADAAIEQGLVEAQNSLRFFELEWLAGRRRRRPTRRSASERLGEVTATSSPRRGASARTSSPRARSG